jgi:cytochrome c oxidase assembly protein subunit 11
MSTDTRSANLRTVRRLALVVVGMFGFGYALVPLYDVFCEITGLNGKTGRVAETTAGAAPVDTARTVTVELVAHVNGELPWDFRPLERSIQVHPGQIGVTTFVAENRAGEALTGHAVPSVAPARGSRYFNKTECFCFTEQRLGPGERREMPVRFLVDRDLPRDVHRLTLSYTFFAAERQPAAGRAQAPDPGPDNTRT